KRAIRFMLLVYSNMTRVADLCRGSLKGLHPANISLAKGQPLSRITPITADVKYCEPKSAWHRLALNKMSV
ncbi:MAG: hypothetical protein ACLQGT_06245, partial [Terracidiphilus sp.]